MKGSYSGASAGRYGGYGGNFAVIVVDFGIVPYHVPTRGAIWSQYFGLRLLKFRTRTGFTTGTVLKIARLIQFLFIYKTPSNTASDEAGEAAGSLAGFLEG